MVEMERSDAVERRGVGPRAADAAGPRRDGSQRTLLSILAATIVLAIGSVAAIEMIGAADDSAAPAPVIAVGEIRPPDAADSAGAASAVAGMLPTNLARVPGLRVLSSARLHEIRASLEATDGGEATLARAAEEAGAREIMTGALYGSDDGRYRLDLRRTSLETGIVRASYRVEGDNPFALVDRATSRLVSDLGLTPPPSGIEDVTTSSIVAYRFYEEGLRDYYDGGNRTARRMFSAALAEDSTFAMAWYYRARTREQVQQAAFREDLGRAADFADGASERESLLIRTAWAQEMDEPRQLRLAQMLASRYPTEPDGQLFLGKARLWSGDFTGALPHLRRVAAMDSLHADRQDVRCRSCDARGDIVTAYTLMDSLAAAERVARDWVGADSGSAPAWRALASTLEYQGRGAEAVRARRRAVRLGSDNPRDAVYPAVVALRAGEFDRAERVLGEHDGSVGTLVQQNVLWYRTLRLRFQGRFEEALEVARRYRRTVVNAETPAQRPPWESVLIAQALLEAGRPRDAADLWRRMAEYPYEPQSEARTARHRAWTLTQVAAALAAADDTAGLPQLADTIQALGRKSAYGRDPRLHHYVRGLLLSARGDTAAAATRFRRALFSRTAGYGRINLELGEALLALGRAEEAVDVVGGALRGPLDAGNLYVNRTELHELLGRAHAAAGQRDSAAAHWRWVRRAFGGDEVPGRRDGWGARYDG